MIQDNHLHYLKFGLCYRFACTLTIHSDHLIKTIIWAQLQSLPQQEHRISRFLTYFQAQESGNPLLQYRSFSPLDKSNYAIHLINVSTNIKWVCWDKIEGLVQGKYVGHLRKTMLMSFRTIRQQFFSGWKVFFGIFKNSRQPSLCLQGKQSWFIIYSHGGGKEKTNTFLCFGITQMMLLGHPEHCCGKEYFKST